MLEANEHLRVYKKFVLSVVGSEEHQAYTVQAGLADAMVVRCFFDLPLNEEYTNKTVVQLLQTLAQSFIESESVDIENPFGSCEATVSANNKPSSSKGTVGLVEYNNHGVAVGVERTTLLKQGFDEGTYVEGTGGDAYIAYIHICTYVYITNMHTITRIHTYRYAYMYVIISSQGTKYRIKCVTDDGTVKMNEVQADGTVTSRVLSSKFEVFTQKYKHTSGIRSVIKTWPEDDVAKNVSTLVLERQSMAQYLVCSAYRAAVQPSLVLQDKPRAGLFADQSYARFKLKLFIFGKVSYDDENKPLPQKCFEVKCRGGGKFFYVRATHSKEEGSNPSAFVQFVLEGATASVKWELSPSKGKDKAHLPYITNEVALKKGDEITLPITWVTEKKASVKRHVTTYDAMSKKAKAT